MRSIFGFIVASSLCAACLADLTPDQARTLATIDTNLKRAETGIPLVEQALGTAAAPSQSQLRLAASRLGAPKSLITQLEPMMSKLPADDPKVQPVKARFDAASKKVAELEAKITSPTPDAAPSTPASIAPTPGAPASVGGTRLDYRQQNDLKDAQYYLSEVDGRANGVAEIVKKVQATADPNAVDFQQVNSAMTTIADARQRAGYADTRLKTLPPSGAGVQSANNELKASLARLDTMEAALKPIYAKLSSTVNPGSYPTLEADVKRLSELAQMYGDPVNTLQRNWAQSAELVKQVPAATAEKTRIMTTYAALLQQQTDAGKRIASVAAHFDSQIAAFNAAADKLKAGFPADLKADFEQINKMAEEAVKEQKPAFFTNGIPDRVERIEGKINLYAALDSTGAVAANKQLDELRANLKTRSDQLKDSIIAANELPPNRYQGSDRSQLEQLATAAWKKQQANANVLAIRIPSQNWERETLWRYENRAWYKIDRSKLQVQLIVKQDDKLAAIQPVNLWKDHLISDQINAIPLFGKDEPLIPQNLLPLGKIK